MATSLVSAIGQAYRAPRKAMSRQQDEGLSEPRALFHLMLGSLLLFVASLPLAVRQAGAIETDDPLSAAIAAHLFGYLFLLPLFAYGAAALLHLALRAFGGVATWLGSRSAMFWSILAGAPVALVLSLLRVFADASGGALLPLVGLLSYAGLGVWVWLLSASMAEVHAFPATVRVAAGFGAVLVGTVVVGGLAAGGPG